VTGRAILGLPGMEPGGTDVPEDERSMPVRPVREQGPEREEAFREALEETNRLWADMLRRLSRKSPPVRTAPQVPGQTATAVESGRSPAAQWSRGMP
jgi:hypothetical protein